MRDIAREKRSKKEKYDNWERVKANIKGEIEKEKGKCYYMIKVTE